MGTGTENHKQKRGDGTGRFGQNIGWEMGFWQYFCWEEADQLVINKYDQGVEVRSTEKQLQLISQRGTWTRDLRISSPAP